MDYTIFCLSADEHLSGFCCSAIRSSAAVSISVQVLCGFFSVLRGRYIGVELLGHVVTLLFSFLRNYQTIFGIVSKETLLNLRSYKFTPKFFLRVL